MPFNRKKYEKHYRETHLEKHREKARRYLRKLREKVFEILGRVCRRCGFSDIRALQIDHKYGGGCKETRSMSQSAFLKKVLKRPELYQILCANCNWIKRFEKNEVRQRKTLDNAPKVC